MESLALEGVGDGGPLRTTGQLRYGVYLLDTLPGPIVRAIRIDPEVNVIGVDDDRRGRIGDILPYVPTLPVILLNLSVRGSSSDSVSTEWHQAKVPTPVTVPLTPPVTPWPDSIDRVLSSTRPP